MSVWSWKKLLSVTLATYYKHMKQLGFTSPQKGCFASLWGKRIQFTITHTHTHEDYSLQKKLITPSSVYMYICINTHMLTSLQKATSLLYPSPSIAWSGEGAQRSWGVLAKSSEFNSSLLSRNVGSERNGLLFKVLIAFVHVTLKTQILDIVLEKHTCRKAGMYARVVPAGCENYVDFTNHIPKTCGWMDIISIKCLCVYSHT